MNEDKLVRSKAQEVYERLRGDILAGALRPSTILREIEIAAQLGVSRTPVREALNLLVAYGLVKKLRNGVVTVVDHSPQEMIENLEVCHALESEGIRLACERAADEQIELAAEALKAVVVAAMEGNVDRYVESNRAFHRALLAGCANAALLLLLDEWWDRYTPRRLVRVYTKSDFRRLSREHMALLEALRNRNPVQATKVLTKHLTAAKTIAGSRL